MVSLRNTGFRTLPGRVIGLSATFLVCLAGCTASWKAPMERRDHSGYSVPHRSPGPASLAGSSYYRVRKGDTLWEIAWLANRDFHELARWNHIAPPYLIYEGQRIRLRPVTSSPPHSRQQPARALPSTSSATKSNSQARSSSRTARRSSHADSRGVVKWRWPAQGKVVSTFKAGDPLRKGIKLAGRAGSDIRAAAKGKVVYSGSGLIGYGRLIIIKHNDKYLSAYGHNRKLLVKQGQQVAKGQKIAEMGRANDGRALLHFEIRQYGKPINPLTVLPRR